MGTARTRRVDDKFLCPYGCGSVSCRVVSSRRADDRTKIVRRRECLECRRRYNTTEGVDQQSLSTTAGNAREAGQNLRDHHL